MAKGIEHSARRLDSAAPRGARQPLVPHAGPSPAVLALASAQSRPLARLRGAETERRWAASLRAGMIAEARRRRDCIRVRVLAAVSDSHWFVVNFKRPYGEIFWPRPEQLGPLEKET